MRTAVVTLIVLVGFGVWPQYLYSFDTLAGRILLIAAVIYLAQSNPLLGLVATGVVVRVLDRPGSAAAWQQPGADRMRLETLMRPKASFGVPVLRIVVRRGHPQAM